MNEKELNDFIAGILQDLTELESMLQVLREASFSKSHDISIIDIDNTLEVMVDKAYNTRISLNKYIDTVFCKE